MELVYILGGIDECVPGNDSASAGKYNKWATLPLPSNFLHFSKAVKIFKKKQDVYTLPNSILNILRTTPHFDS